LITTKANAAATVEVERKFIMAKVATEVKVPQGTQKQVDFDKIQTDPEQFENVRHEMGDLKELAKSIKKDGLLVPMIVRKRGRGKTLAYDLVDGWRRHGAISRLRKKDKTVLSQVPVIITTAEDQQGLLLVNLVSNFQRKEYTQAEMSAGLHRLEQMGMKRSQIAKAFSKTAGWVTQIMRFETGASPELKKLSQEGKITNTAAQRGADLKKKNQKELVKTIKKLDKEVEKNSKTGTRATSDRKKSAASKKKETTKAKEKINKTLTELEANEGRAFFKLALKKKQVITLVDELTDRLFNGDVEDDEAYALGALAAIARLLGMPEMGEDINDIRDFLRTLSIEVKIPADLDVEEEEVSVDFEEDEFDGDEYEFEDEDE